MPRSCWVVVVLLIVPAALRAQVLPPELQTLDRQFQQAIGKADRSVVGILIGRSEHYPAPSEQHPGKLGRYETDRLLARLKPDDLASRRRVQDLDLTAPEHVPEATATGIVLDRSGLILVPAHAVQRARKLYVRLPGNQGSYADIHALDPRSDLAVLKLLDPPEGLSVATLGDGGAVNKGQLVYVLAQAFAPGFRDPSATASWAMVANVRRRLPGPPNEMDRSRQTLHHHGTLLQISSPLNLTTSGGAVLNSKGEVVAITSAQAAVLGQDIPGGFAIPLDEGLRRIIGVLVRGEEVEYGFLGVRLDNRPGGRGVEISSVTEGSPAHAAGLRGGETIVRIDGQAINDADDLFLVVGTRLAGSTVEMEYNFRGMPPARKARVTLARFWVQSPGIAANRPPGLAGVHVDWTSLLSQRNNWGPWNRDRDRLPAGVLVREIEPTSPAAKTSLQVDDIITHVAGMPVTTPAEFYRALEKAPANVEVTYVSEKREGRVTLPR